MQIGTLTLPMKIDSIHCEGNQWVYKVTCDTISEQEYSDQKFIIKPLILSEIEIYERLSEFQGRLIPKCIGSGDFKHGEETLHAFMLKHAEGVPLTDFTRDEISDDSEMKRWISKAYDELSRQCIVHGEAEERHIFINKSQMTVMLIDFDWAWICDNEKDAALQNELDLKELFAKRKERLAY
jgi:hypothetical protein